MHEISAAGFPTIREGNYFEQGEAQETYTRAQMNVIGERKWEGKVF